MRPQKTDPSLHHSPHFPTTRCFGRFADGVKRNVRAEVRFRFEWTILRCFFAPRATWRGVRADVKRKICVRCDARRETHHSARRVTCGAARDWTRVKHLVTRAGTTSSYVDADRGRAARQVLPGERRAIERRTEGGL